MKAFLEYFFLFDPADTWQHLWEFEADLGKFFRDKGYQAELLETVGGNTNRRVVVITPIVAMPDLNTKPEEEKPDTSKKRLKALSQKRTAGKFIKGQYGKLTGKAGR